MFGCIDSLEEFNNMWMIDFLQNGDLPLYVLFLLSVVELVFLVLLHSYPRIVGFIDP